MSLSCIVCGRHVGEDYGTVADDDAIRDVCIECIVKLVRSLKGSRGRVIEAAGDSMGKNGKHPFAASPWIPVTERMPEPNVYFFAWKGEHPYVALYSVDGLARFTNELDPFTHWAEIRPPVSP